MKYIELIDFFNEEENSDQIEFLDKCLNHIKDRKIDIELDKNLIIFIYNLTENVDVNFYIILNEYFNGTKPKIFNVDSPEYVTKFLCCIASSKKILNLIIIESIPISFFLIKSAMDYNIKIDVPFAEHKDLPNSLTTLLMIEYNTPEIFSFIINRYLTDVIEYAIRYSTDYSLINDWIIELDRFEYLKTRFYNLSFTSTIYKVFEWSVLNHHDKINEFYQLLRDLSILIKDENKICQSSQNIQEYGNYLDIEMATFNYRVSLEKDFNAIDVIKFYEQNKDCLNFSSQIKLLTWLFQQVDEKKYIGIIKEEIKEWIQNKNFDIIKQIEVLDFNVLSPYLIFELINHKNNFITFIKNHYLCSNEVLNKTVFYMHTKDKIYISDNTLTEHENVNTATHSEIIDHYNKLFNLGTTVAGESYNQRIFEEYNPNRENKPNSSNKTSERKLISLLEDYYQLNTRPLNIECYDYIFCIQHLRVPLQQLLFKKYNKLFPVIKFAEKSKKGLSNTESSEIKKVKYIVLEEFSVNDQERESIEYLNSISDDITFEYEIIKEKKKLFEVLNSDEYDIIAISSHGNVDPREPLQNKIKIGDEEIFWTELNPKEYNLTKNRLLYLNICDSGHISFKNGFLLESYSTFLTHETQTTVSQMWPVDVLYSSSFLILFFYNFTKTRNFKAAYEMTLSIAVNDKMVATFFEEEINHLALFERLINSSLRTSSLVHWGSMLYQE